MQILITQKTFGKKIEESGVEFLAYKTEFTHNSLLKSLLKVEFVHVESSEGVIK